MTIISHASLMEVRTDVRELKIIIVENSSQLNEPHAKMPAIHVTNIAVNWFLHENMTINF